MENLKQQARLLRIARQQAEDGASFRLERWQLAYLFQFFRKQRRLIILLIILLFFQGIIEAALIAVSRFWLGWSNYQDGQFWLIFCLLAAAFAFVVYWALRQEKTFSVLLANSIRRRLLQSQLSRPLSKSRTRHKTSLLAKIYYQLPLVSMGVTNSFFGTIRWLASFSVAILLAYWLGLAWWLVGLFLIIFSGAVAAAGYFTARRYISQEVTLYSKLIQYLDTSLSDKEFLKIFHQEGVVMKRFDQLVAIDSYFRIRRDIWLKASSRLLFVVLLLMASFLKINSDRLLPIISLTDSRSFLWLFLIVYLSRLANEALRIGLYWFPAKLGLSLTIVKSTVPPKNPGIFEINRAISFSSPKAKIFKQSKYYRRLSFSFSSGQRVLFVGPNLSGKTSLARLFAGREAYLPKAVHVSLDGRRFSYRQWQESFGGAYLFDQNPAITDKTLLEFLLGQDKQEIVVADIEKTLAVLESQKLIKNLIAPDGNLNRSVKSAGGNLCFFALQAAHCLINRPSLIIVDNFWLDLGYRDIIEMLNIISQQLPDSIVLCFSGHDNNFLEYHQRYVIKPQKIS